VPSHKICPAQAGGNPEKRKYLKILDSHFNGDNKMTHILTCYESVIMIGVAISPLISNTEPIKKKDKTENGVCGSTNDPPLLGGSS
jgi:hypothetical protein